GERSWSGSGAGRGSAGARASERGWRSEADPGHARRAQGVRPPAGGRGGGVRLGHARPRTRMGRGGGPGDPRGGATTGAGTGPAGRRARPAAGGVRPPAGLWLTLREQEGPATPPKGVAGPSLWSRPRGCPAHPSSSRLGPEPALPGGRAERQIPGDDLTALVRPEPGEPEGLQEREVLGHP